MIIQLEFKNIVDNPTCQIAVNGVTHYDGAVLNSNVFSATSNDEECTLTIKQYGKKPEETIVENGVIVRDKSFELAKIIIDGYDLEELIWNSAFTAEDGNVYQSCLYFGPNGEFKLNFEAPVLKWILKTRHEKNNNDPTWEEDYNYYTKACQLLAQI